MREVSRQQVASFFPVASHSWFHCPIICLTYTFHVLIDWPLLVLTATEYAQQEQEEVEEIQVERERA